MFRGARAILVAIAALLILILGGVAASRDRLTGVKLVPTDESIQKKSGPQIDLLINYSADKNFIVN